MEIPGVRIHDVTQETAMFLVEEYLRCERTHYISTINPEIALLAKKDRLYKKLLNSFDLNVPDGVGLKYGALLQGKILTNRLTGIDLMREILRYSEQKGVTVVLYVRACFYFLYSSGLLCIHFFYVTLFNFSRHFRIFRHFEKI